MHSEVPELDVDLPEIGQVSYVVRDLYDGMERFNRFFGVEPFDVYQLDANRLTEATYRGTQVDHGIAIALADVGGTSLELVEPIDGPSIHADALESDGPGFHHVACFSFDRPREIVESLSDAGYPPVQTGAFDGTYYWYFDTRDIMDRMYFEIVTRDREKPEPDDRFPRG